MNEISEILNKLLKEDMITIEKALATVLKNINTTFHIIGIGLGSVSLRKYSIVKANYYYNKVGKDIEEWLAEINQIIKANNVAVERRIAVVAAYLRNIAVD